MKNTRRFFNNLQDKINSSMNTSAIGIVQSYDGDRADVLMKPDNDLILDVPVSILGGGEWFVDIPLKPGDMVHVSYAQHETENVLEGREVLSKRRKDINDAIITGIIKRQSNSAEGITIGNVSGTVMLTLTDSGVEISAPGKQIDFKAAIINLTAEQTVKIKGQTESGEYK